MSAADFLIAGGGIGGLTCALALAARGRTSRILEREVEFSEAGAGIQIGPNGMRILQGLGVAERLAGLAAVPRHIEIRNAVTGRVLSRLPLGDWIARRHGAPYWTAHRADLQTALLETVRRQPAIEIVTGFELASVEQTATGNVAMAADRRTAKAPVLIGADGVRSAVRRQVFGAADAAYSGRTAARAVIRDTRALPPGVTDAVTVWLAPGVHIVHYPVRRGAELAVVVVAQEEAASDAWNATADASQVLATVAGLDRDLLALLRRADTWRQWPLVDVASLTACTADRVALLGDAAGPILPFLAQGAVLAMEDAAALASAIAADTNLRRALRRYDTGRRLRRARVARAARRNGRIYHLSGLAGAARNLALRMTSGERLMVSYDWLYGHRPDLD